MTGPFAHGMPVGDHHSWVSPDRLDCPDCPCCTVGLCRTARETSERCEHIAALDERVSTCPCTALGGAS